MTATLLGNIKGPKGDAGKGISSVVQTSSTTNQETGVTTTTYTINYTEGQPTTFEILSAVGAQGIQGPKGDDGKFSILQTYATISAMNADAENVDEGEMVLIASANGPEDPDNAKLYVRSENGFTFLTDLSGAQGIQGVGVSSVQLNSSSGVAGNGQTRTYNVNLTNSSVGGQITVTDGSKGDTGNGISSIAKTGENGLVDTYTITYTDNNTDTFTVTNGAAGATGATGATGETGPAGQDGANGLIPYLTLDENGNLYVEYVSSLPENNSELSGDYSDITPEPDNRDLDYTPDENEISGTIVGDYND